MSGTLQIVRPGKTTVLNWDTDNPNSVQAAKTEFEKEMATGAMAYKKNGEATATQTREFDPEAEKITVTRPLVGG